MQKLTHINERSAGKIPTTNVTNELARAINGLSPVLALGQFPMATYGSQGPQCFIVHALPDAVDGIVLPYALCYTFSNTSTGTMLVSVGIGVAHAINDVFYAERTAGVVYAGPIGGDEPVMLDADGNPVTWLETGTRQPHFTTKLAFSSTAEDGTRQYDILDPAGNTTLIEDQIPEWSPFSGTGVSTIQASSGCCYIGNNGVWVLSIPYERPGTDICPTPM